MTREPEFDRYDDTYDDRVNEALGFSGLKVDLFTRIKAQYLLRLLEQRFGIETRVDVLDVGCGVGNIHSLLCDRVEALTGVDVSEACLDRARGRGLGYDYLAYDGKRLPFADGRFDLAYTICVMHHVPPAQWLAFAAELARVVRPGGLVAVIEHNPGNPFTQRVVRNCEFDRDAVLLHRSEVERLLREVGFLEPSTRSIETLPVHGRLLFLDRIFARLPLGTQYLTTATR